MEKEGKKAVNRKLIFLILVIVLSLLTLASVIVSAISFVKVNDISYDSNTILPGNMISSVVYDSDHEQTIYGTRGNKVIACDVQNKVIWEYTGEESVSKILFGKENIYIAQKGRNIAVLDYQGNEKYTLTSYYALSDIAVDHDNDILYVVSSASALKTRVQIFDGEEMLYTFTPKSQISAMDVDQTNGTLYYVTADSSVYMHKYGEEDSAKRVKVEYSPTGIVVADQAGIVLVSDRIGTVYAFDKELTSTAEQPYHYTKRLASGEIPINAMALDSSTEHVILLDDTGYVWELNIENGDILGRVQVKKESTFLSVSNEGDVMVLNGDYTIYRFKTEEIQSVQLFQALRIPMVVVAAVAFVACIVFVLLLFPKSYKKVTHGAKVFFKTLNKHKKSYLMLLPTFGLLAVFNYFPVIWGFVLSFMDYLPGAYSRFIGLDNFIAVFSNTYFWTGITNMLLFLVTDLLKALIPPVIIAELILAMRSSKAQYWARFVMYVPGILPGLAGLLIWTSGILSMDGLLNAFLECIGLGFLAQNWLGQTNTAMMGLIFIGFPWIGSYIIFYGALMSIPSSLHEAAKLDGCGWWRRILWIDLPLIGPQLKYIFVTSFIGSVQDFGRVYMTTGGGPGSSTYIPALELYYNISRFNQYGQAAAMGLLLFAVIFVATIINMRIKTQSDYGA